MKDLIGGIFLLCMGLFFSIRYRYVGEKTYLFWKRLAPFAFSKKHPSWELKLTQVGFLVAGIVSAIVGLILIWISLQKIF